MSRRLVLIDSSVWVTHLAGRGNGLAGPVSDLILAEQATINSVIRVELLTGARDEAQYSELSDALSAIPLLPLSEMVWLHAERLRFMLRRHGKLVPVPDVVIACCALVHDCELLHADRHFNAIADLISLKIHRVAR